MSVTYKGPAILERLCFDNNLPWYDRVTHVDLGGSSYDDRVVDALTQLRHLKSITLYHTKLTDQGVERLRRKLPSCEILVQDRQSAMELSSGGTTEI